MTDKPFDTVAWLREQADIMQGTGSALRFAACAAEIERLQSERDALREALRSMEGKS